MPIFHKVLTMGNEGLSKTINSAAMRENLSSVFPTKRDSNQSPQLQRLCRKLEFQQ